MGLFGEMGPVNEKNATRENSWVTKTHLLAIDSPVGTGLSYTNDGSYCTTDACLAADMVTALAAFYVRVPEAKRLRLHLSSESYGGKVRNPIPSRV